MILDLRGLKVTMETTCDMILDLRGLKVTTQATTDVTSLMICDIKM